LLCGDAGAVARGLVGVRIQLGAIDISMKFKLPIVLSISLVATLLLFLQGVIIFYVSQQEIEKELRQRAITELYNLSDYQQMVLEHFYTHNEQAEIQRQISAMGSEEQNLLSVLLDDTGQVIASTRLSLRGEQFNYSMLHHGLSDIKSIVQHTRQTLSNYLYVAPDNSEMVLVQPVVLGYKGKSLRPDKIGVLIIRQDLSWVQGRVLSALQSQQLPVWLSVIVFLIVLGVTIYWGVIKRIKHISHVAFKVSEGDHSLRAKDSGSDEIGFLARFFNEMLDSMEANQDVLANAFDEISSREQNLTLTLQSIGDAVIVTDAEENIIRMNLVARELTGWSEFDAIGQPIGEVFNIVDSDTRERLKNPIDEVMRTGNVVELGEHTTLVSSTGREYHISDSAAPIKDDQGVIHGVIMVFQDITEEYNLQKALRDSEQRLRMALQATEEGLWDWNIGTGKVYYSPRWIDMLGYHPGDIMPDISSWKKLIHPDDLVQVMQQLQLHLRGDAPGFEAEHRLKKADGSYLWVLGRGKVTEYDHKGRPLRVVGTASDISEEKEHQEQMRRAQKMEAMGKLTGGIAHDYNNMLGVILGYAELLQMQVSANPKQSMYIESILRAAERAKKLTNSLLKFSRRKETEAEAVDINQLLREDEDMLSKTLTARVELQLELSDSLWPVYIDSGDLEDAILNMAINAMHAMSNDGVLTISTRNSRLDQAEARILGLDAGDFVCLELADTGSGMDEETVARIFDPFFSTKGDQGTGLGLSQVYGFVQRSQGSIRVISEPGAGTQFLLYFPRYHEAVRLPDKSPDNGISDYSGSETILVVDDEYALRSLAEEILSLHGYRVLQAQDGNDALQLLEHHHVDLILSDVIMPGMNGYQLAQQVREKYPAIKIQMVSGFNSMEEEAEIDERLHKDQMSKPFNAEQLLKRIRYLLDGKAPYAQLI